MSERVQGTEPGFTVMPPLTNRGESSKAVRFQSPAVLSVLGECASHPAVYAASQYGLLAYRFKYEDCGLRTVKCKITLLGFLFSKPNNAPYIDSCKDRIL